MEQEAEYIKQQGIFENHPNKTSKYKKVNVEIRSSTGILTTELIPLKRK